MAKDNTKINTYLSSVSNEENDSLNDELTKMGNEMLIIHQAKLAKLNHMYHATNDPNKLKIIKKLFYIILDETKNILAVTRSASRSTGGKKHKKSRTKKYRR